jgi:hypothetical protein
MTWDTTKQTNQTQSDVPDNEQITAAEWNNHVADQQSRGYDTVTTVTGNYTIDENEVVLADASGGSITVTLPSPSEASIITVKKTDSSSNSVVIATPSSESIDGGTSLTITGQYVSRELVSDGSDYYII